MYLQEFDLFAIAVSGRLLVSVGESLECVSATEGALTVPPVILVMAIIHVQCSPCPLSSCSLT